jgi:hypothetical protein
MGALSSLLSMFLMGTPDPQPTTPPLPSGVMAALGLLGKEASTLPIQTVSAQNENLARGGQTVSQAWVKPGDNTIYVADWTDDYRKAEKGDLQARINLAAAIAHEAYHVSHGEDEAGAYDEQLRVLRDLGAKSSKIKDIERARAYVIPKGDK